MKNLIVLFVGIVTLPLRLVFLPLAAAVWILVLCIGEPRTAVEWVADVICETNWRRTLRSLVFGFGH